MALKKSELYSSLWQSCNELRGGMDASQYKDYVLAMLFIKYVSDKYAGNPFAPIQIPEGASFKDMVAFKGSSDIGDQINKKIIAPLKEANKLAEMADFNDKALPKIYSQDLLNNLFRHPYTKIDFVMSELAVSRITATRYLDELSQIGLLEKRKIGRENFYINTALFDLLGNVYRK